MAFRETAKGLPQEVGGVMFDLRPYQAACIEAINTAEASGIKRQIAVAATGAGKTCIFASLLAQRNQRALILAHTGELLQQAQEKLRMIAPGISSGLVCADQKEFDSQVVISSIQSALQPKNLSKLKEQNFEIIIVDEAHHAAAASYRSVLKDLGCKSNGDVLLLGFTATAFREDGKGLAEVFDKVIFEVGIKELIQGGYLIKPQGIRMLSNLDLSRVETSDGDYNAKSLSQVMDTPEMIAAAVESYIEHAEYLPAICFGCSIEHADNLAKAFIKRGVKAASINGKTPKDERNRILKSYGNGEIDVITNCSILCEGYDAPHTQAVIIARPTRSRGLFTQMAGRGLRLFPNKARALILDFGDSAHSLVTSAELLQDAEVISIEDERLETAFKDKMSSYPTKLNQRLKLAAVQAELLAEENGFAWSKDFRGRYYVKGSGEELIRIDRESESLYSVRLYDGHSVKKEYGSKLDFEYAFCLANEVIKKNKDLYVLSDLKASWRNEGISQKQIDYMKKGRFSAGLESLTKGQAALIIGSGSLRKVG